ncbi:MAG: GNAT family N-acetyltransferase [Planctomycetota bacterium]|jgi:GNAT superfamily N-acetyltransferase
MEYITVTMTREDLDGIPQHPLLEGYRIRSFRRGDRGAWVRVEQASEPYGKIDGNTFDQDFAGNLPALKRRQLFLVAPDGSEVGTITAWYTRRYHGRPWGRIHWLAIVPAQRGKRLGKALMTAAMNRLRTCGHRRAMLVTHTCRIAAIKTYLDFGFLPDMRCNDAERAWQQLRKVLNHPALR